MMETQAIEVAAGPSDLQPSASQQNDGGKEDPSRRRANVRKRTKTGCLTCRKRRIKCDEGRPRCNNCIKSKRLCEGYNQRVVFKEPMGSFQTPFNPGLYPAGSSHLVDEPLITHQGMQPSRLPLQAIAPRPPAFNPSIQGLPANPEHVLYQQQLQPDQISRDSAAYGLNTDSFSSSTYSHIPNPLVSPGANAGAVSNNNLNNASDFQYFNPEDANMGEVLPQNRFNQAPPLTTQLSNISPTFEDEWEYDVQDDDDASMLDSDDDIYEPMDASVPAPHMLARSWGRSLTESRPVPTFAHSSAVSAYVDYPHVSDFFNNGLNVVFIHFINVTGPSISLYERHSFDAPEHEQFATDATSKQSPWSYTFPVLALRHPGLLHAMLALANLQISKLQDSPPTTALKHYHRAIRRIAKNVKSPLRRTHPATLAATLLLGYFEVWSSDHTKWCNHLFGARILLREIPLREMTRACLPMKKMRIRQAKQVYDDNLRSSLPTFDPNPESNIDLHRLDYDFFNAITGQNIQPEDYNDGENQILDEACASVTDKDIEKYDTLCNLFWWYCKMDVYQSILGGTKLFMEYECWTQCPPRAPASRRSAIYGTYDHLMLLLGRLANFSSKDLSRKRKASQAQGGGVGGSPPMFPGMLPTQGTVHVPMGFSPPRDATPQSDSSDDIEPQKAYEAAVQQWTSIHQAFETFEKYVGPKFQPLSNEFGDQGEATPFGPAMQFQTFSIAGIWMNYYMGLIHLHRSHPSMPPAAMRAAGMTGHKTGAYAIKIGQIAAGLSNDCTQLSDVSTFLGAALIESSFCLFVAAVQYRDPTQRQWIVQRMHDIVRLTGWQSARQIADGCESAWTKAAQMGGPPYQRTSIQNDPAAIGRNPRRIDRKIHELDQGEERRLVLAKAERTHYALGLLGVEEDLRVLELRDELN